MGDFEVERPTRFAAFWFFIDRIREYMRFRPFDDAAEQEPEGDEGDSTLAWYTASFRL
jgi:hypothetical protein